MSYPKVLRYSHLKFGLALAVGVACMVLLAACMSAVTERGVMLKVGPAATQSHGDVIAADKARGTPNGTTDWATIVLTVGQYLGLGGAGLLGLHGVVSALPWSSGEKADIAAMAKAAVGGAGVATTGATDPAAKPPA